MLIDINFRRDRINAFKPLITDLNHSPLEKSDVALKLKYCMDCGISEDIVPVTYNGYCKHCAELHRFDNY